MSTTEISNLSLKDLVFSQDNSIDIRDCYVKTGIEGILQQLDEELVGLESVKTRVREISSVLLFDRIREIQELPTLNSSLHMSFTGRPGTGKTSVAAKLGLVLRQLGYLTKGHITNVTREDLVGQYVGHTAPKTKEQLNKARGGILFMDEAQQSIYISLIMNVIMVRKLLNYYYRLWKINVKILFLYSLDLKLKLKVSLIQTLVFLHVLVNM